jgi:hypothetical protein
MHEWWLSLRPAELATCLGSQTVLQPGIRTRNSVVYTQSSILRNADLRNHWWGGARKRINQKGSDPGNAIFSGDPL